MPALLQRLMRHRDIHTTLRYYVGQEAEDVADVVWEAFAKVRQGGSIFGNTPPVETVNIAPA